MTTTISLGQLPPPTGLCVSSPISNNNRRRKRYYIKINCVTEEIRVCTNRTCRRQGSAQTLEALTSLAPPNLHVKSCGCLGRCGAGPNLVALPDGIIVRHCGTAARAAEVMFALGVKGSDEVVDHATAVKNSLEALALRNEARSEMEMANFSRAELLLSQALDLKPYGGVHVIYKDRSVARLALGKHNGALEDARKAVALAPHYVEAYIREGDVLLAVEQYDLAEKSFSTCLQIDPSIRRSKPFKTRIMKLQEKLATVNNP